MRDELEMRRSKHVTKAMQRPADAAPASSRAAKAILASARGHPSSKTPVHGRGEKPTPSRPVLEPASIFRAKATQNPARAHLSRKRRSISEAKATCAPADVGDDRFIDPVVVSIQAAWCRRQAWHRSEKSLTL